VIITHDTINVSKYIQPITIDFALDVCDNLREDDRRELVEGYGLSPTEAAHEAASWSSSVGFVVPNGKTAGMAGVLPDKRIWMLCTDAIHDYPHTFAREAKRYVDSRTEMQLWNVVDKRNTVHLRLLKFLGFRFIDEVEYGPNNLPFIRFSKWDL